MTRASWGTYVAVGDSITEGMSDPVIGRGEPWLGWADRLAGILHGDAQLGGRDLAFANLAVRGRRVADVVDVQIPAAIDLGADLVSVLIGGNDLMALGADPDAVAARLEPGIAALRARNIDVLLGTCFDPQYAPFLGLLRGRAAVYNANMWSIARTHRAFTLDLWGMRELHSPAMWAEDRVHLGSAGHRLLASRAAHTLGVAYYESPQGLIAPAPSHSAVVPTTTWIRRHAIPWMGRRLRGVTLGDGMGPKLPALLPMHELL